MGGFIPGARPINTGSAAAPGLPFAADADSGIYFPVGGGFGIAVNGQAAQVVTPTSYDLYFGGIRAVRMSASDAIFGYRALDSLTTGVGNAAFGPNVLTACTGGNYNTGGGVDALMAMADGDGNTAFGYHSLRACVSSALQGNNSAFGAFSGDALTTGRSNLLLGAYSGNFLTTGYGNVIIGGGFSPNPANPALSNTLAISGMYSTYTPIIYGTFDPAGGLAQTLLFNADVTVNDTKNFAANNFTLHQGVEVFIGNNVGRLIGTNTAKFQHESLNSASSGGLFALNENSTSGAGLFFLKTRGTTYGSVAAVVNGDNLFRQGIYAADGSSVIRGAYFHCAVAGPVSAGVIPTLLNWGTTNLAGVEADRMRLDSEGNLLLLTVGMGHRVKEGSNAKQGIATLVAGAVTVSNSNITANSRIFLTSQIDGGTPGFIRVSARVAGTSFTITSSSGTDTSTVAYEIFEPA